MSKKMSKNQFRLIIILSLVAGILGGAYDYIWPNPIVEGAYEYVYENEAEMEGWQLGLAGGLGVIAVILAVASFIGLLLFRSWSKLLYVIGFVVAFSLYPFMGVTVYSPISQIFYDLSMILSGVILALIYSSPIVLAGVGPYIVHAAGIKVTFLVSG